MSILHKKSGVSAVLQVTNIGAEFKNRTVIKPIFGGVSFRVLPGSIFVVFGPNGSGKSTLLRVVTGLMKAAGGSVIFPPSNQGKSSVAYIPQNFRASFYAWCSLARNIALTRPDPFKDFKSHLKEMKELQQQFGTTLDLTLRPGQCSGGMLQQAAMIRAFMGRPQIVFADEPFSALDVNIATTIKRNFKQKVKRDGTIIVSVMHGVEDILELADQVLSIPNMPYSTSNLEGYHRAEVLQNNSLKESGQIAESNFVVIAKEILGAQN